MPLIMHQSEGLYCAAGDFYIDPWRGVERALITHGHADHARRGSDAYLCAAPGEALLRARLGEAQRVQSIAYGEALRIGDANVSFHPAGHVLGSAQIRVEVGGEVWVVSGDYKCPPNFAQEDKTCAAFEPVRCDTFITESTFGLPIYRWQTQAEIVARINAWWGSNAAEGLTSIIYAYSLGKAQRLLAAVDASIGPLICHASVATINEAYRRGGIVLPAYALLDDNAALKGQGALIIVPPGGARAKWPTRWGDISDASASGWMQLRGARRRQSVDRGFVLSDHADWPGLMQAIHATGAKRVLVTHGSVAPMVRHLREQGFDAAPLATQFGEEIDEPS